MVTFRIALNHEFGEVSIEGSDEKEVINNLTRLKALGRSVAKDLGFDIKIPNHIADKITDLEYVDRIMVIMSINKKPLTKPDCKNYTRTLSIPENWWNGSNFERDMRKRRSGGLVNVLKKNRILYSLTREGKTYIRDLTDKIEG